MATDEEISSPARNSQMDSPVRASSACIVSSSPPANRIPLARIGDANDDSSSWTDQPIWTAFPNGALSVKPVRSGSPRQRVSCVIEIASAMGVAGDAAAVGLAAGGSVGAVILVGRGDGDATLVGSVVDVSGRAVVGVAMRVSVGSGLAVEVAVLLSVAVGVLVSVGDAEGDSVGDDVTVIVTDAMAVAVSLGLPVAVGVDDGRDDSGEDVTGTTTTIVGVAMLAPVGTADADSTSGVGEEDGGLAVASEPDEVTGEAATAPVGRGDAAGDVSAVLVSLAALVGVRDGVPDAVVGLAACVAGGATIRGVSVACCEGRTTTATAVDATTGDPFTEGEADRVAA